MSEKKTEVQRLVNTLRLARDLKWHVDAEIELNRLQSANAELMNVIKNALQTIKFEKHAFRTWHADAKEALAKADGETQ